MTGADAAAIRASLRAEVEVPALSPMDHGLVAGKLPAQGCVAAIGAFDGVHRGHVDLVDRAADDARRRGLPLVVTTFDPDPSAVVGPRPQAPLMTAVDRLRTLWSLGPDAMAVFRFDRALAGLSYGDFVTGLLVPTLHPAAVHVGEGFSLGARGEGTVDRLRGLCGPMGIDVVAHPLLELEGAPVSATRIRAVVAQGEVQQARELLGRYHYNHGTVVHGRGEGKSFGFPTANVLCPPGPVAPGSGVYAGVVAVDGRAWPAAINAGLPPTFAHGHGRGRGFFEAALLGFSGDLYGMRATVVPMAPLRSSVTFGDVADLKATVLGNIEQVRERLGDEPMRL